MINFECFNEYRECHFTSMIQLRISLSQMTKRTFLSSVIPQSDTKSLPSDLKEANISPSAQSKMST